MAQYITHTLPTEHTHTHTRARKHALSLQSTHTRAHKRTLPTEHTHTRAHTHSPYRAHTRARTHTHTHLLLVTNFKQDTTYIRACRPTSNPRCTQSMMRISFHPFGV